MNRELIIPNLHVVLVHYPIGVFFLGLLIELGSFMWRRSSVRAAGRWMILLGSLSMIPSALSGAYALRDVAMMGNKGPSEPWSDVVSNSQLSAEAWSHLLWHTWLMSAASVIVVVGSVGYLAMSDRLRNKLYWLTLGLLLIGAGATASGAWFAGEAIFKSGVAVMAAPDVDGEVPSTQAAVAEPPAALPGGAMAVVEKINTAVPPLQPHVIMAGMAVAVALAAVGVSVRRITGEVPPVQLRDGDALVQSLSPAEPPAVLYSAKFWLVAMTLFILTSLGGWYVYGSEAETFNPKEMWQQVSQSQESPPGPKLNRGVVHAILATTLIVLPLILAGVGKWAPKNKLLLGSLALVLLLAILAQLWIGLLLSFDGSAGGLTRFI